MCFCLWICAISFGYIARSGIMSEGETTGLLFDPFKQRRSRFAEAGKLKYYLKVITFGLVILFVGVQLERLAMQNSTIDEELSFKIYSHNIRYDNKNLGPNERPWEERKYEIVKSIKFMSFKSKTIITLQEVLKNQLDDILELLNENVPSDSQWTYFGVGRLDGKEGGEYGPIIYNTADFKLIDSSTFWLSETPDVPSRGWDADQNRIVTWARLQNGSRSINIFNTHLDHIGVKAREESVKLIADKTTKYNDDISFITGDFNSEPEEGAYQTLSKVFKDARLYNGNQYGYQTTFTDFIDSTRHKIIDYIFIDPRLKQADGFGVLGNFYNGLYSSDHRPVVVEISI